jgi:hypothetical protein
MPPHPPPPLAAGCGNVGVVSPFYLAWVVRFETRCVVADRAHPVGDGDGLTHPQVAVFTQAVGLRDGVPQA